MIKVPASTPSSKNRCGNASIVCRVCMYVLVRELALVLASISATHLLSVWTDRLVLRVLPGKGLPSGSHFPSLNTKSLSENQDVGKNELNASQMKECQVMLGFLPTSWFSDRKSTRLNSSHQIISYAVFCLKKKNN